MSKDELQKLKEALYRRDGVAVDEMNNGRYPGIEGRLEFVAGRAEDSLLFIGKIIEHLIGESP